MLRNAEIAIEEKSQSFSPVFARHETFHPRYGWIKKGYDAVANDPDIFSREDASVVLGVGKNMVKAIKYWGIAFKVIKETHTTNNKQRSYATTQFGEQLLSDKGWDPYLEDPASLLLLHWGLVNDQLSCKATTWWFAFNAFHKISFTQEDFLFVLKKYISSTFPGHMVKDSSLKKDINCLLRMYVESNSDRIKESAITCPFTELSLIKNDGDSRHFSFNLGEKHNLPPEIIIACCLNYIYMTKQTAATISISRLLYENSSPGLVFKLTEAAICHAIETVSRNFSNISLSEAGGLLQFCFEGDPSRLRERILRKYYKNG